MDEPWEAYTKWNKPTTHKISFHLYEVPRVIKFIDGKQNGGCQGIKRERGDSNHLIGMETVSQDKKKVLWVAVGIGSTTMCM